MTWSVQDCNRPSESSFKATEYYELPLQVKGSPGLVASLVSPCWPRALPVAQFMAHELTLPYLTSSAYVFSTVCTEVV
jgi:hypothetical protein